MWIQAELGDIVVGFQTTAIKWVLQYSSHTVLFVSQYTYDPEESGGGGGGRGDQDGEYM